MVEGGALSMFSMFTGVGGALPERGRDRPEEPREQLIKTPQLNRLREAGGRGLP